MHILILSPEFPPEVSGVGDYAYFFAKSLHLRQHRVSVISSVRGATQQPVLPQEVAFYPILKNWDASDRDPLLKKIRQLNPDIIHINYHTCAFGNYPMINTLPAAIRRHFKAKVVTTYHELAAPWKRLALLPMLFASHINVFTNDRDYDRLGLLQGLSNFAYVPLAGNIEARPCGAKKIEEVRNVLGVQKEDILLLRFGFINALVLERAAHLLRVLSKLKTLNFPVKMVFIGKTDAACHKQLMARIEEFELKDRVHFLGEATNEQISYYLQAADIGLAPYPDGVSERRGAFLGLLHHNLPTLTTRGKHFPKKICEGKHVETVPAGSGVDLWVSKLKVLIEDPSRRVEMRKNLKTLSDYYSWRNVGQLMSDHYDRLLKGNAG